MSHESIRLDPSAAPVRAAGHQVFAIVIPVHNEEELLSACLRAACRAMRHVRSRGHEAFTVVVLDRCTDNSHSISTLFPVQALRIDAGSVGAARAAGAARALALGATWLAFTDADSEVSADWLSAQGALGVDAVCGTVSVGDWTEVGSAPQALYESRYRDVDGHRHVHGANLGVSARAYRDSGGFEAVCVDEDVGLVKKLMEIGRSVVWSAQPRVVTSARLEGRVASGFAGYLRGLKLACDADGTPPTPY